MRFVRQYEFCRPLQLPRRLGSLLVLVLLVVSSLPGLSPAASVATRKSVTLAWEPSYDPGVAGYKLYYGTTSQNYTNVITVGKVASVTVTGLVTGVTYFFAATTYNQTGVESPPSAEVSYTVPITPPVIKISGSPLQQIQLTVTGEPNHSYQVQASQDLANWAVIGRADILDNGLAVFIDPNSAQFPSRFYRLGAELPPPPRLQILITSTGVVILSLNGQSGHPYQIEASQNLTNWSMIASVSTDTNGLARYIDTNASRFKSRFYRARDNQ